jgi:hypothetical protein
MTMAKARAPPRLSSSRLTLVMTACCSPSCGHCLGDAARLVEVDRLGAALGHGAESAAARAQVAEHHEGRGFVVPALADVGAVRAFAHGVQESERASRLRSW